MGMACPFSSSAIQYLIQIAILLRDTLVYDSENWWADQPFPVVSLFLCLGPNFIGAVISVIKVYGGRNEDWP